MNTSIPVTESEMNSFFGNALSSLAEFKARMATNFVAASEQAATIEALRQTVERLQTSVDNMNNTIKQLTEDRNQAQAERDRAVQSERVALEMAETAEREVVQLKAQLHEAHETIFVQNSQSHEQNNTIVDLRAMNERQMGSLEQAIRDNQALQERISSLAHDYKDMMDAKDNYMQQVQRQGEQIRRLLNILGGAKALLEDIPAERNAA